MVRATRSGIHRPAVNPPAYNQNNPPTSTRTKRRRKDTTSNSATNTSRDEDVRPPASSTAQPNHRRSDSPVAERSHTTEELPRDDLTVHNYHAQKRYWPLPRIQEQLAQQSAENNNRPAPLILAEAFALWSAFQHDLEMVAMVGDVSVEVLKKKL